MEEMMKSMGGMGAMGALGGKKGKGKKWSIKILTWVIEYYNNSNELNIGFPKTREEKS